MKLSEIFEKEMEFQSLGEDYYGHKYGMMYALDNLTPKIAIDFAKWSLSLGSNYYYCKNSGTWYIWENDEPIEEEKVFQEFLKDYKG